MMTNLAGNSNSSSGSVAAGVSFGEKQTVCLLIGLAFVSVVFGVWLFAPAKGWAAGDSSAAHFPIINYFIKNGFDLNYQSDLVAMFPGMHMLFASAARLFALHQLSLDGLPAFLFQSVFGVFFLAALLRIVRHTAVNSVAVAVLVLPAISTSYILYSWVWPTTELGSIALYAWMLALLVRTSRVTAPVAISHSLLTAMSIFLRQSNAVLGFSLFSTSLFRALTGSHQQALPTNTSMSSAGG
jgi:hypothetical protein